MTTFYFGTHIKYEKDLLDEVKKEHSKGANCFQFFLTSPKRRRPKLTEKRIEVMTNIRDYCQKNGIRLFIHSPYTLNFAQKSLTGDSWWIESMITELTNAAILGVEGCVLHLGKSVGNPEKEAYANMKFGIESVIDKTKDNPVKILLETSSGQGSELGSKWEDFAAFYNSFSDGYRKRLGICLDTCHTFVAGYDWREKQLVKENFAKFESLFGKRVDLIHLNDSAVPIDSHLDRHAPLLTGYIGKGLNM